MNLTTKHVTKDKVIAILKAQKTPVNYRELYSLATGSPPQNYNKGDYTYFRHKLRKWSREDTRIVIRPVTSGSNNKGAKIFFRPQYAPRVAPPTPPAKVVVPATVLREAWPDLVESFLTSGITTAAAKTLVTYRTTALRSYYHMFGDILPKAITIAMVDGAIKAAKHTTIPYNPKAPWKHYSGATINHILNLMNQISHFAKHNGKMNISFDQSAAYVQASKDSVPRRTPRKFTRKVKGGAIHHIKPTPEAQLPTIKPSLWARIKGWFCG